MSSETSWGQHRGLLIKVFRPCLRRPRTSKVGSGAPHRAAVPISVLPVWQLWGEWNQWIQLSIPLWFSVYKCLAWRGLIFYISTSSFRYQISPEQICIAGSISLNFVYPPRITSIHLSENYISPKVWTAETLNVVATFTMKADILLSAHNVLAKTVTIFKCPYNETQPLWVLLELALPIFVNHRVAIQLWEATGGICESWYGHIFRHRLPLGEVFYLFLRLCEMVSHSKL